VTFGAAVAEASLSEVIHTVCIHTVGRQFFLGFFALVVRGRLVYPAAGNANSCIAAAVGIDRRSSSCFDGTPFAPAQVCDR
jgi:hypothetical protein